MKTLQGVSISKGLAAGPAFLYPEHLTVPPSGYAIDEADVDEEYTRTCEAIHRVRNHLEQTAQSLESELGGSSAAVFHAHRSMLSDSSLHRELRNELASELVNAEEAVRRVFYRWERRLRQARSLEDTSAGHDMRDLGKHLLRELSGVAAHHLEDMPPGCVLVASRLLPSDAIQLAKRKARAVVVETATRGSHVALLVRELGIPTVANIPFVMTQVAPGEALLVDAYAGSIIVDPDEAARSSFHSQIAEKEASTEKARAHRTEPARTVEGQEIAVLANVMSDAEVDSAIRNGAEGIGLFRLEGLFLDHWITPSEDNLRQVVQRALRAAGDRPVTFRLLDLGGDKVPAWMEWPPESNPFLGRRGIRFLLEHPPLLERQLRVFLEASCDRDVRILVPMVTLADDMAAVRQVMERLARTLELTETPPLGAMIETPAAALGTADIARHADFLSIGTNDLTQYTLAAGRENTMVAKYFQEDHPAVFELIELTCQRSGGRPVSVCGELAANLEDIPHLLSRGVRGLSVAPAMIPAVKEAVRTSRAGAYASPWTNQGPPVDSSQKGTPMSNDPARR